MAVYEPYSEVRLSHLASAWLESGLHSVRIIMGPLIVVCEWDIFISNGRIISTEHGHVDAGSLRWHTSKYIVFKCLYGYLRMQGVHNIEWEMPNEFLDFDYGLYLELVPPYYPFLRVKYPSEINQPLCVENLWSNAYMKIYPTYYTSWFPIGYPSGDTT